MAIKKGDRLILKEHGLEITVEAASDEKDGHVEIKAKGTFSTVNISDVRAAANETAK